MKPPLRLERRCSRRRLILPLVTLALALLAACERRNPERLPGRLPRAAAVQQIPLEPGHPTGSPTMTNPFEGNPFAIGEGRRLYNWYNCAGCHFAGGGGIGPPLMDDDWIYGSEPENILATIMEGRPNGMPAYRGKLPQDHALKIVAYVRSLGTGAAEAPGRGQKEEDTQDRRVESFAGEKPSGQEGSGGTRSP